MKTDYKLDDLPKIADSQIVILKSKWHITHIESMESKCREVLGSSGCQSIESHTVSGCLELPLAARWLMQKNPEIDAIIVFGVILKGQTYHFNMILDQCNLGFTRVSHDFAVPIVNEILPVDDIEHVVERTGDNKGNKGYEAAIAAIEMINFRSKVFPSKKQNLGF